MNLKQRGALVTLVSGFSAVTLLMFQNCTSNMSAATQLSIDAAKTKINAKWGSPDIAVVKDYGSVYVGMQSWFSPGVGPESGGFAAGPWLHYTLNGEVPGHFAVDMWPDTSMYDSDELFPTQYRTADGQPLRGISSGHPKTIDKHVEMMRLASIQGPFLQRFLADTYSDPKNLAWRDQTARNLRASSDAQSQTYAIEYDLTDCDDACIDNFLLKDFYHLKNDLGIFDSANYLKLNGRPVISLWGFGFKESSTRRPSALRALRAVTDIQGQGFAVRGGVPFNFRTSDGDASGNPDWHQVYGQVDIISPWSVGRFGDSNQLANLRSQLTADVQYATARGKTFIPILFPGFTWSNLMITMGQPSTPNQIKRQRGTFLWDQAAMYYSLGVRNYFIAMFDEVNEGTAIFPVINSTSFLPAGTGLLGLDLDGTSLPSDYYLRVAKAIAIRMQNGYPISAGMPESEVMNQQVMFPGGQNLLAVQNQIDSLYRDLLGREAALTDLQGAAYTCVYNGNTIDSLRQMIANSPESIANMRRLAVQILGRDTNSMTDAQIASWWGPYLVAGGTLSSLTQAFNDSEEAKVHRAAKVAAAISLLLGE